LVKDFCIAITTTVLSDLTAAQTDACHVELILHNCESHPSESEPIDTFEESKNTSSREFAIGVVTRVTLA
jgi:hypothetical protein